MSELNEKYIGESSMLGQPSKKLVLVIADGAVTTEKIENRAVTPEKLSPEVMTEVIEPGFNILQGQINSLQAQVTAILSIMQSGPAVPVFEADFSFPINTTNLSDHTLTVTNGFVLTEENVIANLKFYLSYSGSIQVIRRNADNKLVLFDGTDEFNTLTVTGNTITFGSASGGPELGSFEWGSSNHVIDPGVK